MPNGTPISWSSKKQVSTTLSSTEAEYVVATQATKEAIWLRAFMKELLHPQTKATIINEDNQGAIELSKNPVHHERTKHIDIQWHFVREKTESGEIVLKYVHTSQQAADVLTKPLNKVLHKRACKLMGLNFDMLG